MKKLICGIGLVVMLSGCAVRMMNPNVTQAQAERDWEECKYVAITSIPVPYGRSDGAVLGASLQQRQVIEQCLKLRGYQYY